MTLQETIDYLILRLLGFRKDELTNPPKFHTLLKWTVMFIRSTRTFYHRF